MFLPISYLHMQYIPKRILSLLIPISCFIIRNSDEIEYNSASKTKGRTLLCVLMPRL